MKHGDGREVPRLSAAITTPSLNFNAITDVPVTTGDCVCVVGPWLWLLWR
jgi:hypothetical protein